MKIGIVQPEITDWDIETTGAQAIEHIKYFKEKNVDLIIFPEYYPGWHKPIIDCIKKVKSHVIIGETIKNENGKFQNTGILISPEGKILGRQIKKKLMPREINEMGYVPGKDYEVIDSEIGKIGIQVCYDFTINPEGVTNQVKNGAELIVVIAGAVKPLIEHWKHIITTRSIDNGVPVAFSNYGGVWKNEEGKEFGGGYSRVVVPITDEISDLNDFLESETISPLKLVKDTLGEAPGYLITEIDLKKYKRYREDILKIRDV